MTTASSHATHNHLKADALLLLASLTAAAGWIFSREALSGFAPLSFMALRFSLAGLILAFWGRRQLARLSGKDWRNAAVVGGLFGIAMVFWVIGLKTTEHVGVGAFLTCLGLVSVPLLTLLFGERASPSVYLAIPVAVAGLACLSLDSHFSLGMAELCFLMAALFLALMFILNSHAAARIPALPLTAIQLLITGAITGIGALGFEQWSFTQPADIWGWFAASLVFATCVRFWVQTHAQGMAPPSHSAIIMTLEPVWTALLAALWLGERMSTLQITGCGLIFLAMLVNRGPALRLWLRTLF